MTHFNSKEEAFKDLLGGLDFDLDTNEIWNAVEDKLPRKKEEPKLPWIIWGLSFVVLGLFTVVLFQNPVANEVAQYSSQETTSLGQMDAVLASTKALEQAIDKVTAEMEAKAANKETIALSAKFIVNNKPNSSSQAISNTAIDQPIKTTTSTFSSTFSSSNNTSIGSLETKAKIPNSISPIPSINQNSALNQFSFLDLIQPQLHTTLELNDKDLAFQFATAKPIEVHAHNPWLIYYQALSGPSKNLSHFSSEEETKNLSYESDLIGLSSQFIVGYENSRWNIFGGLGHSYNASRFSNHDLGSDTQSIPVETLHILGSGETEERAGFVSETTVTQNAIDWHRIHQNVDLHFGVGRKLISLKAMSISLEGAVNYNIWSRAEGYYYSKDFTEITKFSGSESNPYNNSNGLGAQLSFNIEYQLGAKSSIIIKPFAGKYFNPITEENLSYQIRNSQIGLQIGISYRPTGSY